ncbi:MAG: PASTA domain-containing protein [Odoribacteraceae bacterium]|jgi:beta-lactam-binding protein with PASTA domain|nr:PASTA domain-containing protein [Odoribacteraceae bacterium]
MHLLERKIRFWFINIVIAVALFIVACAVTLYCLDGYTRHGHYILVPDLRGLSPVDAAPVAGERELFVVVVDSVYNRTFAGGVIVEQFPLPDARVKNNRVIQLTVNARSLETVPFPDLLQFPYRQTLQKLKNLRLKPGKIEYVPSPYANLVTGFRRDGLPVEPGTRVPVGVEIDILLGEGEKPGETVVPRLDGKTLEEARDLLLHAYLNTGEVIGDNTVKSNADRFTARVHDQFPAPEQPARRGSRVTLYLSKIPKKTVILDTTTHE